MEKQVPFDDIDAFMVAEWCDGLLTLDGTIQVRTVKGVEYARPGELIKDIGRVDGLRTFEILPAPSGEDGG